MADSLLSVVHCGTRLLTVAAPTIPDGMFEDQRKQYGDNQVASMVLLAAYGNFQDRIVLGLQLPVEEQRAYTYARKLSKAPWTLTTEDFRTLEQDLGPAKAMSTFWWLCRGLYMTRISDGFQLPLERENVISNH